MTTAPRTSGARHPDARRGPASPMERAQRRTFWPFLAPALTVFALFFVAPTVFSVWLGFQSWDGVSEMRSRGLKNYANLLNDPLFLTSLKNTALILVVGGAFIFVISFAITMILRDMTDRRPVRYVLFFPVLVNPLVFGVMTGLLFRPTGIVNTLLGYIGVDEAPRWLAEQNLMTMIIAVSVWAGAGYYTTILMSGVEQIPTTYYEAAELDGAGAWHRFRHVTLPLSWDVVTVCALLWTITTVKVFELVLVFGGSTGGSPPNSTFTTALFVYDRAFSARATRDFGSASAAALVSLALIAVVAVLLRRILRRDAVQLS